VSSTTLNVCGGVPREISEKSGRSQLLPVAAADSARALLTLRVEEVANGHGVGAVGDVRRLEDLLHVRLGLDAHVLLAERSGLLLDVGVLLSGCQRVLCRVMRARQMR
jgi:hypothetical protein